jgi:hypothetical protein
MRHDTEAYLLLLRQRATDNADLTAWIGTNEERIGGVMDTILDARGDDAGRFIGGARKDRGMFTKMLITAGVLTAENLAALEARGEDVAYREISRDKLIPKPVASTLKELGDGAGVAYAKIVLHGMITPRPYNSPAAREKYVRSAKVVNEIFATPYTRVRDLLQNLFLRYGFHIAMNAPEAVVLTIEKRNEIAAKLGITSSWNIASGVGKSLGLENYKNSYDGTTIYYENFDTPYHRRETDEEKKARASLEQPLGPRFGEALDPHGDSKTKWFEERSRAFKFNDHDDWSWAAGTTPAEAVPEEERAEALTREEVLGLPDCAQMKEDGSSPDAALFYLWAYRNIVPKKSTPTKAGRAAYETALAAFDRAFADLSNHIDLVNRIQLRSSSPQVNVLPVQRLDDDVYKASADLLSEEWLENKTPSEKNKARMDFLSQELGLPVAGVFSGRWRTGRGGYTRMRSYYYYRVSLPQEEVDELVKAQKLEDDALKATSAALYALVSGQFDKKTDAYFKKVANTSWAAVDELCAKVAAEAARGGGGARFTEPDRGVIGPRVGPPVPGPHTSDSIERTTGLYGVEYGEWMNEADKATVNVSVAEALHDFAEILGVPLRATSLGERLAIGLGSRGSGKFSAHYEPFKKVINMTRTRGAGAFAHEWGHALDHWLADAGQSGRVVNGNLASYWGSWLDGTNGMQGVDVTKEERKTVNDALVAVLDILLAGKGSYDEVRMRRWDNENPSPGYYNDDREAYKNYAQKRAAFRDSLAALAKSNDMLRASQAAGKYWQENHEMFARAWESFILDSLEKRKRESGYLVRGTKSHPVYPLGAQRERLFTVLTAFLDTLRPVLTRLAVRPNGRVRRRRPWWPKG